MFALNLRKKHERNHIGLNLCDRENRDGCLSSACNVEASSVVLAELLTPEDQQPLGTTVVLLYLHGSCGRSNQINACRLIPHGHMADF